MDKNNSVSNCQHSPPSCIRPFNTLGSDEMLHIFGFFEQSYQAKLVWFGDHGSSRIRVAQVWKYSSRFSNQLVHRLGVCHSTALSCIWDSVSVSQIGVNMISYLPISEFLEILSFLKWSLMNTEHNAGKGRQTILIFLSMWSYIVRTQKGRL